MRVICTNEGLVSNFELLELLRQRTREPGHAPRYPQPHDPFPTELQCYGALSRTLSGCQTRSQLSDLLVSLNSMSLTSAECLNLINLKPSCNVEIYLVIDAYEERLAGGQMGKMLKIIAELS